MSNPPPTFVRRYAVALLALVVALLVKEALGPEIVPGVFLTFYAAVLVSALYGGFWPGMFCAVLATIVGGALFLPPIVGDDGVAVISVVRLALFLALSAILSAIVARRKIAQLRVAESEARLRRLVESDMIGVLFWEREGAVTDANDELLRMIGYTREDLREGRIRWNDITPPEYQRLDAAGLAEVDATGSCAPFEKEYVRKDGSRVPILIARAATTEARDRGVAIVLDITARKRVEVDLRLAKRDLEMRVAERTAELQAANARLRDELAERQRVAAALRESEERYRQVSEVTSDYAYRFRIEPNGRIVFEWHAGAFQRITGWDPRQVFGLRGILDLVHADDHGLLLDRTIRLLRGETVVSEYRVRTQSGEYRWLRDHGRPQWDEGEGRVVWVVGAARDITERRRAEDDLRLSEERFALAVAGANDGVWDWRVDIGAGWVSDRFISILGYESGEIELSPEVWVGLVHPDDFDRVAADITAHLDGLTPHFRSEYRLRRRDGTYRWVLSRGVAVRDAQGHPYRMAGSLTDITPRRQAEEDARRRQAELAHAQRLSTLGEMAAGLAHELNQPLAAIVSYASGCERRIRSGDLRSAEQMYAIQQIAKQALRAGDVLQRYRNFVRSGATRREWVNMNELTQEVAQLAKPSADEEHIAIRLDLAPELPMVMADSVQIEQVLVNLIRNGLEAMQGCGAGALWVRTRLDGEAVEVGVEDAGIGIADDIRDRIFDAFFTTKGEGLGMGLSISRSIIDAHGGRLWPLRAAHGTIFRFTVPLVSPENESVEDVERLRRRG